MNKPWRCLEEMPGLVALVPIWRRRLGDHFDSVTNFCFHVSQKIPTLFPCSGGLECVYRIIRLPGALQQLPSTLTLRPSTVAIGFCQRHSASCPNLELSQEDITPLEIN